MDQLPETRSAAVLLIGTEPILLYTRKIILESKSLKVSTATPGDAVGLIRKCDYDVVVACHTLEEQEAESLAQTVKAEKPATQLIRFTKQPVLTETNASFDATVWSLDLPDALISSVFNAVQSRESHNTSRCSGVNQPR